MTRTRIGRTLLAATAALLACGLVAGPALAETSPATDTTSAVPSSASSVPDPSPTAAAAAGPACTTGANATTPVVCLPAGSGEDQPGKVVLGSGIEFDTQIVNNGPAVDAAEIAFSLPPGLRETPDAQVVRVDDWYRHTSGDPSDFGAAIPCSTPDHGATLTCRTGPIPAGTNALVIIDLSATSAAKGGTSATFTTTLSPIPPAAFPTTSVQATVDYLYPANLDVSFTPASADVVVGATRSLTVTVHNVGGGAAPNTFAVSLFLARTTHEGDYAPAHFAITNAPVVQPPGKGIARTLFTAGPAGRAEDRRTDPTPFAIWPVGTIAPGATAHFTVRAKALTVGTDSLLVGAESDADDPECQDALVNGTPSAKCHNIATGSLTAIAAHPSPTHGTDGSTADPVANTGAGDLTPQLLLGALAVVVGLGLTAAGRRHYRGRHAAR